MAGIRLFGKMILLQNKKENGDGTTTDPPEEQMPGKTIPCPRCESDQTKFCYFNNYNVNQPRHFCKGCQRYWTAGGVLRNVPVGAGIRKNRPLSVNLSRFSKSYLCGAGDWPFTTFQEDLSKDLPAKRRRVCKFSQNF